MEAGEGSSLAAFSDGVNTSGSTQAKPYPLHGCSGLLVGAGMGT